MAFVNTNYKNRLKIFHVQGNCRIKAKKYRSDIDFFGKFYYNYGKLIRRK